MRCGFEVLGDEFVIRVVLVQWFAYLRGKKLVFQASSIGTMMALIVPTPVS